ncbi:hypothetical protein EJ02DRAFT_467696 [Clathrospora elynae]|uniref:Uncharacterized protein n=1 Tax=Clathrospora elynae TaxID=706981 RepID=A0A6A5SHB1_9PLEO|nr:hypothetical protein EJ02DRAFT_467696 [Clathrospora elynae]
MSASTAEKADRAKVNLRNNRRLSLYIAAMFSSPLVAGLTTTSTTNRLINMSSILSVEIARALFPSFFKAQSSPASKAERSRSSPKSDSVPKIWIEPAEDLEEVIIFFFNNIIIFLGFTVGSRPPMHRECSAASAHGSGIIWRAITPLTHDCFEQIITVTLFHETAGFLGYIEVFERRKRRSLL